MDSQTVIQLQQQHSGDHPRYPKSMMKEINELMRQIPHTRLPHAYCEANQAANELSNQTVKQQAQHSTTQSTKVWKNVCSPFLLNITHANTTWIKFPRNVTVVYLLRKKK